MGGPSRISMMSCTMSGKSSGSSMRRKRWMRPGWSHARHTRQHDANVAGSSHEKSTTMSCSSGGMIDIVVENLGWWWLRSKLQYIAWACREAVLITPPRHSPRRCPRVLQTMSGLQEIRILSKLVVHEHLGEPRYKHNGRVYSP